MCKKIIIVIFFIVVNIAFASNVNVSNVISRIKSAMPEELEIMLVIPTGGCSSIWNKPALTIIRIDNKLNNRRLINNNADGYLFILPGYPEPVTESQIKAYKEYFVVGTKDFHICLIADMKKRVWKEFADSLRIFWDCQGQTGLSESVEVRDQETYPKLRSVAGRRGN